MKFHFNIDPERLTMGDMVAMEDFKSASWAEKRNLLSNSAVDEKGEFIDPAEACKILNSTSLVDLAEIINKFSAAVMELMNNQHPPEIGSGSI